MKKVGLFTIFQVDDVLYRAYQNGLNNIITKHRGNSEYKTEIIEIMPQGTHYPHSQQAINISLFESCFRTELEFAVNIAHCDILAIAANSTYLHSLAEEVFAENSESFPNTTFISLSDCAIAACDHYKQLTRPCILCQNNIEDDLLTCSRFAENGYQIKNIMDPSLITELNRRSIQVLEANQTQHPNIEELRNICGMVESSAKNAHINGILLAGYFELYHVLLQGGVRYQTINLFEEHIKAIANAVLS